MTSEEFLIRMIQYRGFLRRELALTVVGTLLGAACSTFWIAYLLISPPTWFLGLAIVCLVVTFFSTLKGAKEWKTYLEQVDTMTQFINKYAAAGDDLRKQVELINENTAWLEQQRKKRAK